MKKNLFFILSFLFCDCIASDSIPVTKKLGTIYINCNHPTLAEQVVCYPNRSYGVFDKKDSDLLAPIFGCEQLKEKTIADVKAIAQEKGYLKKWSGCSNWQVNSDGSIVYTHHDDLGRFDAMAGAALAFMQAIYKDVDYVGKKK